MASRRYHDKTFFGYSFTRANPIRFEILSGCNTKILKDVIKQVIPLGVPLYEIHKVYVIRQLFFQYPYHIKY
ncbi:hypothetical protein GmHk_13G037643 [Glycine max]|nr:hypothetical protein GmHk_13G037643 [Glycine max]